MKTIFLVCSFLIIISSNAYSQLKAVTQNGKEVVLNKDGTWHYIDNNKSSSIKDSTCEHLVDISVNDSNGKVTYISKKEVIVFDGIEGFAITIEKVDDLIHLDMKVVSDNTCVDNNTNIEFTFVTGSKINLTSDTMSNCEGEVNTRFITSSNKMNELYQLSTKKVSSIRVWTRDGPVEQKLSPTSSSLLLSIIVCISEVDTLQL